MIYDWVSRNRILLDLLICFSGKFQLIYNRKSVPPPPHNHILNHIWSRPYKLLLTPLCSILQFYFADTFCSPLIFCSLNSVSPHTSSFVFHLVYLLYIFNIFNSLYFAFSLVLASPGASCLKKYTAFFPCIHMLHLKLHLI